MPVNSQQLPPDETWWDRPGGGREVLRVAAPLVVSTLSWTVMTFVDRMFLKNVSGIAMAAAFTSGTLWFCALSLPLGICSYASTFVSQYFGDRQYEKIGPATWQGVWSSLIAVPILLIAVPLAPTIFEASGHQAEMVSQETIYFRILAWGGPGLLAAAALSSFYSGRGKTRTVMWVDSAYSILNLVLDYLWIFGHAGFPAMGIAGAAWATVLCLWLKAATYAWLVLQPTHRRRFHSWSGMRFDPRLFARLMIFGGPAGFQTLLDVAGYSIFILLVGRLGVLEAEATGMAFSISSLAFMPVWGCCMAGSILVGQRLGEDRPDLAERTTWTNLRITATYMTFISALYVFTPNLFLSGFFASVEVPSANDAAVRNMAIVLLRFVAAYNLLDACFMVFCSALKGAGDTKFVLWVSVVMSTALIGLTWLSVEVLQWSVYGCWAVISGWLWAVAVIYYFRFRAGYWRDMRVIESAPKFGADLNTTSPECDPQPVSPLL